MDAYCEHLGAHLGYGGTVVEDRIRCPFHGWEWNDKGRNVCIPYEDRPNLGRRIFTGFGDGASADDYYPLCEHARLYEGRLELHPQYVLENGVDFAHFKYVHQVPIVPLFTSSSPNGGRQ